MKTKKHINKNTRKNIKYTKKSNPKKTYKSGGYLEYIQQCIGDACKYIQEKTSCSNFYSTKYDAYKFENRDDMMMFFRKLLDSNLSKYKNSVIGYIIEKQYDFNSYPELVKIILSFSMKPSSLLVFMLGKDFDKSWHNTISKYTFDERVNIALEKLFKNNNFKNGETLSLENDEYDYWHYLDNLVELLSCMHSSDLVKNYTKGHLSDEDFKKMDIEDKEQKTSLGNNANLTAEPHLGRYLNDSPIEFVLLKNILSGENMKTFYQNIKKSTALDITKINHTNNSNISNNNSNITNISQSVTSNDSGYSTVNNKTKKSFFGSFKEKRKLTKKAKIEQVIEKTKQINEVIIKELINVSKHRNILSFLYPELDDKLDEDQKNTYILPVSALLFLSMRINSDSIHKQMNLLLMPLDKTGKISINHNAKRIIRDLDLRKEIPYHNDTRKGKIHSFNELLYYFLKPYYGKCEVASCQKGGGVDTKNVTNFFMAMFESLKIKLQNLKKTQVKNNAIIIMIKSLDKVMKVGITNLFNKLCCEKEELTFETFDKIIKFILKHNKYLFTTPLNKIKKDDIFEFNKTMALTLAYYPIEISYLYNLYPTNIDNINNEQMYHNLLNLERYFQYGLIKNITDFEVKKFDWEYVMNKLTINSQEIAPLKLLNI